MVRFNRIRQILAILLLILGTLHSFVATRIYTAITLDALWFFSGGIAMICVALTNLHSKHTNRSELFALAIQNTLLLGFFIAVWSVFPAIQVALGIALLGGLLLINLINIRTFLLVSTDI